MSDNGPSYIQQRSHGLRRLLSIPEAAKLLGIAERTLRNRLGKRAKKPFPVKPKRIGTRVFFDARDLERYINEL